MFIRRWRGASGIIAALCAVLLVLAPCFSPTFAHADDAAPEVSLDIASDKQAYQPGETAHLTLTASHDAGRGIRDVSYEVKLSSAFDASGAQLAGKLDDMGPGDVRTVELDVPVLASESIGAPGITDPADTGAAGGAGGASGNASRGASDASSTPLAATGDALGGMLALAAARVARERRRAVRGRHAKPMPHLRRKATPALSVLLAVSLTGVAGVAGTAVAFAAESPATAAAKTTVQISGTEHELSAVLSYIPVRTGADAGDGDGDGNAPKGVAYKEGVIVLENDKGAEYDPDDQKVVVPNEEQIAVGDIVVVRPASSGGRYNGGVIRVEKIQQQGATKILTGSEPALEEFVDSMHVDESTESILGFVPAQYQYGSGASARQAASSAKGDKNKVETFEKEPLEADISLDYSFSPGDGTIELSLSAGEDFGAAPNKHENEWTSVRFSLTATITPKFDVATDYDNGEWRSASIRNVSTIDMAVTGALSYNDELYLGKISMLTPSGFGVFAKLYCVLSLEGTFSIEARVDMDQAITAEKGLLGPDFSKTDDSTFSFGDEPKLNVALGVETGLEVGVTFLEVIDAYFEADVGPHIKSEAETHEQGRLPAFKCLDLISWLEVSIGVGIDIGVPLAEFFAPELSLGAAVSWDILTDSPSNPLRAHIAHLEKDGDVPWAILAECTWYDWTRYASSPAWAAPDIAVFNRLGAPFAMRAGQSVTIGDRDDPNYVIGGIGISVTYQILQGHYEMTEDAVMRVTLYNQDGTMRSRYIEDHNGRRTFLEGSDENIRLIARELNEETTYEVLKGALLVKQVNTRQIPSSSMGTCETFGSLEDAKDALGREPAIANSIDGRSVETASAASAGSGSDVMGICDLAGDSASASVPAESSKVKDDTDSPPGVNDLEQVEGESMSAISDMREEYTKDGSCDERMAA